MTLVAGAWQDDRIALADDLFLIALDERTGRFSLNSLALNLGLAGALVGELILSDHIGLSNNRLTLAARAPVLIDAVHQRMLRHLRSEPDHPIRVWLSFFAQTARDDVAERIVRNGLVKAELRGVIRSRESYVATDNPSLAWRTLRLAQLIHRREVQTSYDLMLIGLVAAIGLDEKVLANGSPDDRANLRLIAASVAEDAAVHAVTTQVSALIAAGVLSQRK